MSVEHKLGELIPPKKIVGRDAVHCAIVPLIAAETLYSGHHFKLMRGTVDQAIAADPRDALGIIDPFLSIVRGAYLIQKGERCYGFLKPGTTVGMTHHWAHPAFDTPETASNEHEAWIWGFCDRWNFDYETLIAEATSSGGDRYIVANGKDLHSAGELGDDHDLFWQHLEAMTGRSFDEEHRTGLGWSCSC